MEDSYTVHRRRKAAARRREKTPEPPRRLDDDPSDEEEAKDAREEAARAKIERMVEDTEKLEEVTAACRAFSEGEEAPTRKTRDVEAPVPREERRSDVSTVSRKGSDVGEEFSAAKNRASLSVARDGDAMTGEIPVARSVKPFLPRDGEEGAPAEKEIAKGPGLESAKVARSEEPERSAGFESPVREGGRADKKAPGDRRAKKRSRDRSSAGRREYTPDSSDAEERRGAIGKKSHEGPRSKVVGGGKRRTSRSRGDTDTDDDPNTSRTDSTNDRSRREKRPSARCKYSTGTDEDSAPGKREARAVESTPVDAHSRKTRTREKRSSSARHGYPSDSDDDATASATMKKSETFPQQQQQQQQRALEKPYAKRSASETRRKQIIPLDDDSLIQDFAKAQEDYLRRERGILDPDPADATRPKDAGPRKRKKSVVHSDSEHDEIARTVAPDRKTWFSWLSWFRRKQKQKVDEEEKPPGTIPSAVTAEEKKAGSFVRIVGNARTLVSEFRAFVERNPEESRLIGRLRNRCAAELILIVIYCGLGAMVFRFTEGAFETFYKCGVKRVKRDFLDSLWNYSHNMREDDWKSMARRKLMEFEEQLHTAHEAGVHSYSGQKSWTFLNAFVYCLTVVTTIGYGHISPSTKTGRALTIVYAIFGIPIFLIILADFGKLFTRGMKFLWAFIRRLYYTGSCRSVRRTAPVQEVMKGVQLVYDLATWRRPSQLNPEDIEEMQKQGNQTQTVLNLDGNAPNVVQQGQAETPGTPAMSNFAIDDEFNLPISVAIFILLGYIMIGATIYNMWEEWDFFESFYFVFISMSTIGFGDYVPKNPVSMVCSIVYLVFGLALTSMCINVVQTILSDSFKQASQKIGATIGFEVVEEDGSIQPAVPVPVELADVHTTIKESDSAEKIAPRARQEDVDV